MTVNGMLGIPVGHRSNRRSLISLIVGLVVGFCMAELFTISTLSQPSSVFYSGHQFVSINDAHSSRNLLSQAEPKNYIDMHQHSYENTSMATKLQNEVKVLCWIMTYPENHQSKARHVKRTWGKRCNKLLFMSSAEDEKLGSIALPVAEGRDHLWAKTKEAFKYIYNHHMNDADWFLKADDDTYTIVENLRYMLYPYSPETPIYFGCKFKVYVKQGYMSGGAGYVLSKEAVRRFVEKALPNPEFCKEDNTGAEDVEIGKCLENVNVIAGDSRDPQGRGKFFPFSPQDHLMPKLLDKNFWYWKNIYYKPANGMDNCSDYAISFHYITPDEMHALDFLLYRLRPYGIENPTEPLPDKLRIGEILPPPIDESDIYLNTTT